MALFHSQTRHHMIIPLSLQEDQDAMEVDLDKDEVVRAEGDEQSGEKLLSEYATSPKSKRRVSYFIYELFHEI